MRQWSPASSEPHSRANSADSELLSSEIVGGLPLSRALPLNSPRFLATAVRFHSTPVSSTPPSAASVTEVAVTAKLKDVSPADVRMAALYVDAALHGRKFAGFQSDNNTKRSSLRAYRVLHSDAWRFVYIVSCLVHVLLACFERPSMLTDAASQRRGVVAAAVLEWLAIAIYVIDLIMYSLHRFPRSGVSTGGKLD
jgi:hypothetical protein